AARKPQRGGTDRACRSEARLGRAQYAVPAAWGDAFRAAFSHPEDVFVSGRVGKRVAGKTRGTPGCSKEESESVDYHPRSEQNSRIKFSQKSIARPSAFSPKSRRQEKKRIPAARKCPDGVGHHACLPYVD